MAKLKFMEVQNILIDKYNINIVENSTCKSRTHAHVDKTRRVCKWKRANSIKSLFELAHEIGHVETYKSWMRRCESEFYATEWAIKTLKEFNIETPQKELIKYQKYIYRELQRGLNHHGNNLPTKEELKLTGYVEDTQPKRVRLC